MEKETHTRMEWGGGGGGQDYKKKMKGAHNE